MEVKYPKISQLTSARRRWVLEEVGSSLKSILNRKYRARFKTNPMYESSPAQPVWYKVRFLSSHLWSVWNEHIPSLTVNTKHQALGEIRSNWTKTIPEGRKCAFTSSMQCSCWEQNTSRSRNAVRHRSGWNLQTVPTFSPLIPLRNLHNEINAVKCVEWSVTGSGKKFKLAKKVARAMSFKGFNMVK